jgi:exonuclease-1
MGIPGLLPLLKPITRDKHIKEYSGMRAAVDGLCWLHRAINSADESDMAKYISICMYLINLLLSNGIRPVVVFDGMSLPAKSATNEKRRMVREQCLLKMIEAERNGFYSDADRYRRQAMVVGDEAVQAFIAALCDANVDYIVAPYEADAQLAFMSLRNLVDVVITEDSDCLVYGCRRILFKMDSSGRGQEICRRDLGQNKNPDFEGWTDEQFKLFCCLAGCDYVPRVPSVGIKTAHKIVTGCPSFRDVARYLGRHKPSHCDATYFGEV